MQMLDVNWGQTARVCCPRIDCCIRAGNLAWEHNLRGYDAVHLAAALSWGEALNAPVTLATFDRQLWQAAKMQGLRAYPDDLTPYLRMS